MSKLDKFIERKQFRIFETKNYGIYKYLLLDINELVTIAHKEFLADREEFEKTKGKFEVYKDAEKDFLIKGINHWLLTNQYKLESIQYDDDETTQKAYEEIRKKTGVYDTDPAFIYWQLKRYSIIRESKIAGKIELIIPSESLIFIRALIEMNEETRSEYKEQMAMLNEVYEIIRSKAKDGIKFTYEDWYRFNNLLQAYNSNLKSVHTTLGELFEQIMEDTKLDVIVALKNFRENVLYPAVSKIFNEGTETVAKGFARKIEEDGYFDGYWLNDNTFWPRGSIRDYKNGNLNTIAYEFATVIKANELAVDKKEIEYYINEVVKDFNSIVGTLNEAKDKIIEIRGKLESFINYIIEYEQRNKLSSAMSIGNILNNILIRLETIDCEFALPSVENKNYTYENSYIPFVRQKKEIIPYKQLNIPKISNIEEKKIKEKLKMDININVDKKIVFNKFIKQYPNGVDFKNIQLNSMEDFGFSQALSIFSSEISCPYKVDVQDRGKIQRQFEENNIIYDVRFKDNIRFEKGGK